MITALEIVREAMDAAIPNFGGSPVDWKEEAHPREAKGGKGGGQFAKKPETLAKEDERDELNPAEAAQASGFWRYNGVRPHGRSIQEDAEIDRIDGEITDAFDRYARIKASDDADCETAITELMKERAEVNDVAKKIVETEIALDEARNGVTPNSTSWSIISGLFSPVLVKLYGDVSPKLFTDLPKALDTLNGALDTYEQKLNAAAQKQAANQTVSSAVNSVLANLKGGGANGMTAKILNALANGGAGAGQVKAQQTVASSSASKPQNPNQFGPKAPLPIDTPPPNLPLNTFDSWQSAGSGSTHPHKINVNGEWYFAKRAGDNPSYTEDAAQNEVSANSFIRMAGLNAPESWLMRDGKNVFCVTKGVDTHKELTPNLRGNKALAAQVREAYPVMALVYNTDVMKNSDNAYIDRNGNAVFVDNGSTFGFSAQGTRNSKHKFGFDYDKRVEADSNKNIDSGIMALAQHPDQGPWRGAFTMGDGFTQEEVLKEAAKYNMADLARTAVKKGFVPKTAEDSFVKFAESLDALSAPYKAQ